MILLSAGHNPRASGASYFDKRSGQKFNEYEMATAWCDLIRQEAGEDIVTLVPTGKLHSKVVFINAADPVMAIELHFNSARDANNHPVGSGFETLYYPGSTTGKRLAERLQDALSCVNGIGNNRGAKEGYYRMLKKNGPDFFLAKTKCPALIIEPAFIHEQKRIGQIKFDVAKAIAEYIRQNNIT